MSRTEKQRVGSLGEDIGCRYLKDHGFRIIDRNYRKKWGEIDIIAQKEAILHFVEVKSVTCDTLPMGDRVNGENIFEKRPEDNVHPWKLKRLGRAIQSFLLESRHSPATDWQLDVMAVFIEERTRRATVRILENVIIEE